MKSRFQSINELEQFLDHYLNFEKHPQKNIFWLDTVRFFCEKLGNPQKSAKCVHVAGSKGKGSVSVFSASILNAAGFKTGLYTSPHLLDFAERVRSAEDFLSDAVYKAASDELIATVRKVSDSELPGGRAITWFELVTLFAFLCFRQFGADWSVFEVGLGGRLDATNVILPEVCCITPLELEHTEFLGDTLEKIATEKCGIIKKGIPVVTSAQKTEALSVIKKVAAERESHLLVLPEIAEIKSKIAKNDFGEFTQKTTILSPIFSKPIHADLKLLGKEQAENAALAAIAIKTAYPNISDEQLEKGLSAAFLPARFEIVPSVPKFPEIPFLVIDGAHTVNSTKCLLETLFSLQTEKKPDLLFACAADKDVEDIAELLAPEFDKITLTIPGEVKKADFERTKNAFLRVHADFLCGEQFSEMITASLLSANERKVPLVVCGSFYLAAEVKKILL